MYPFLPFGEVAKSFAQAFMHAAGQMCWQPWTQGREQGSDCPKPVKHTLLTAFGFACRVHKVSGILVVDGALVLLKRGDKDPDGTDRVWYEPFGGKPDYNYENPQGLLRREGQEELGITVRVGECLGIARHPKFLSRTVAYFKCECPKGEYSAEPAPAGAPGGCSSVSARSPGSYRSGRRYPAPVWHSGGIYRDRGCDIPL